MERARVRADNLSVSNSQQASSLPLWTSSSLRGGRWTLQTWNNKSGGGRKGGNDASVIAACQPGARGHVNVPCAGVNVTVTVTAVL